MITFHVTKKELDFVKSLIQKEIKDLQGVAPSRDLEKWNMGKALLDEISVLGKEYTLSQQHPQNKLLGERKDAFLAHYKRHCGGEKVKKMVDVMKMVYTEQEFYTMMLLDIFN